METSEDKSIPMNHINQSHELDSLKRNISSKGDTLSYIKLRTAYMDMPIEDLLYWSKIMADKYDYVPASYDVYQIYGMNLNLTEPYSREKMGDTNYQIAIGYLKNAASKGNNRAQESLKLYK